MERVAVLGAGPMGLAVAYQLIQEGYQPVIYEADDRVGGMSAAFDFDGLEIERYYHFHCVNDVDFQILLSELNLTHKLHWTPAKIGYYFQGGLHRWGDPLSLLKFPGLTFSAKLRYGLHSFLSVHRKHWHTLDRLTAINWLQRWIGKQAYEALWSPLLQYKFYDYAPLISAAWLWSRINQIGKSRYNLFKGKFGYLEGGCTTLLKAMQRFIEENGGIFYLRMPVSKIILENNQVTGVESSLGLQSFHHVISTIPVSYIPQLIPQLPDALLNQFSALKNIAVVCVIAKLRKSVSENFWLNINDPSMDMPGVIEYTNLRKLDHTIIYAPFYMPAQHPKFQDSDSIFKDKVKRYLQTINQTLKDDDFMNIHVHRYRYAQPICQPGHLKQLPPIKLPIQGLWVADTSYYYPKDRGISNSVYLGRKIAKAMAINQ